MKPLREALKSLCGAESFEDGFEKAVEHDALGTLQWGREEPTCRQGWTSRCKKQPPFLKNTHTHTHTNATKTFAPATLLSHPRPTHSPPVTETPMRSNQEKQRIPAQCKKTFWDAMHGCVPIVVQAWLSPSHPFAESGEICVGRAVSEAMSAVQLEQAFELLFQSLGGSLIPAPYKRLLRQVERGYVICLRQSSFPVCILIVDSFS